MFYALLKDIEPGKELIPVVKQVCQDKMDKFGEATGNGGAIHLDPKYCAEHYPHKKTIVYGYMLLAYVSEVMENNFGEQWLTTGVMDMKFVGLAHPGQAFIANGKITEIIPEKNGRTVVCNCEVVNQGGGKAAVGTTQVFLPD